MVKKIVLVLLILSINIFSSTSDIKAYLKKVNDSESLFILGALEEEEKNNNKSLDYYIQSLILSENKKK